MRSDRSPSRRTVRTHPYASSRSPRPFPSPGAVVVFTALPVLTVVALSFPVATAAALTGLCGGVAGAALHRRYPSAVDRTLRPLDGDVRSPET